MAKKAGSNTFNMSEEIRNALKELGKKATHTDVGDYLTKKFSDNPKLAKAVSSKHWYQTVYGQRKKLMAGDGNPRRLINKKKLEAAPVGAINDVALFALKHGGIEGAKAALDDLAQQIRS
ncbi:MAG: hypothetical protein U0872_00235 [Planctomycetaceae bacterium]